MEDFCSKAAKLLNESKINDLLSAFKSKSKSLSSEEIDYFYELSMSKRIYPLSLLILNLRLKRIKRAPMSSWDKWLSLTSDYLSGDLFSLPSALQKIIFKLSVRYGELSCELSSSDYLRQALSALLHVLEHLRLLYELTPVHYLVCKLGLMLRSLFLLEPLVDADYIQVCKNSGTTGAQSAMFFYYLGSIALILKKPSRAMHFYELSMTIPSKVVHAASIESFKKQVLLKLIIEGSEYHASRHAPPRFSQIVRQHNCEAYTSLAMAFVEYLKNKVPKETVLDLVKKHMHLWTMDKNQGLIKRISKAMLKHKIKKLTKVYASLTFTQLKKQTEEETADDVAVGMIESGEISGKIDRQNEMVVFIDHENRVRMDEVQETCERLLRYAKRIEGELCQLALDPRHLRKVIMTENLSKNR